MSVVDSAVLFPAAEGHAARVRALVDEHYAFVHRSLRRLGVPEADVEDASQQVFLVASRRAAIIVEGAERSFLFGVALRTAADARRKRQRRREVYDEAGVADTRDPAPSAEVSVDASRARRVLDEILDRLPMDLRAVLVLAELEEMTMASIAQLLEVPPGTVASRLRRARECFAVEVRRVRHRLGEETP